MSAENESAHPWVAPRPPERILAIRLQATGDVIITLPYLNDLKDRYPRSRIDLLTRKETESIPRSLSLFRKVFAIGGGRNFKLQCLSTLGLLPRLGIQGYDVVLDLQDNEISRFVTRALRPGAWSRFDKKSPLSAGERTRMTIDAAGLGVAQARTRFETAPRSEGDLRLREAGWIPGRPLVVLNPAGAFASRNWPLPNYVAFAREWQRHHHAATQFLLLGVASLKPKASFIADALGPAAIDLVGRTSAAEAFDLVRRTQLVISEDSGLMHMAWVCGVPTLALFGSSRGDWSRPLGAHTLCLDSSDLDCGFCMEPECMHGDVRCLTRYRPERVAAMASDLLDGATAP